jgi:hypothetical protein
VSSTLVTTTATQTITGKTISADDNTLSGIAASSFVLSNGSGNIDGSAAQKAIPSGVVVGTTDTQTLTNKTLSTGTAITDGTINGATIGASTASTGAFTTLTASGAVTFNDAGANVDFRVEGDTDANLLFVDASADSVGIGTNGPAGKFNVSGSVANDLTTFSTADAATTVLNNANGVATGRATKILFRNTGFNLAGIAGVFTGFNGAGDLAGALAFGTQTNVAGGVVERMRITSAGNVGIGTSSPGALLDVNGGILSRASSGEGGEIAFNNPDNANVGLTVDVSAADTGRVFQSRNNSVLQIGQLAGTGGFITLHTAATERMRIDSNGRVLVGTTSEWFGRKFVSESAGEAGVFISNAAASGSLDMLNTATSGNNLFSSFYTEARGVPVTRGGIDYNRAAGLTRYNTTSDATLKNLIGDADGVKSVELLSTTRIREYAWKSDLDQKPQIGVIAQELYETFKGAVSVGGEKEDGTYRPWGVDKTAFTFHLIAGWQEHQKIIEKQQAIITALTARVEALEAK